MQLFGGKFVKGSETASVYWRRRAIVAAAALTLVVVAVVVFRALGSDGATAEGQGQDRSQSAAEPQEWTEPSESSTLQRPYVSPTAESDESDAASASPSEPAVAACADDELLLQVVAAFDEARAGTDVPVSVLVAGAADGTCEAELGDVAVELAAGDDVVYSTAHCHAPEAASVELEQGAGQTVEFTLDGLASDEDCEGDRRRLPAGAYEMRARLGGAQSQPATLTLS